MLNRILPISCPCGVASVAPYIFAAGLSFTVHAFMALDETSLLEEIVQAKEVSNSNIHLLGVMDIEYITEEPIKNLL